MGHILRMQDDKIAKAGLNHQPQTSQKRVLWRQVEEHLQTLGEKLSGIEKNCNCSLGPIGHMALFIYTGCAVKNGT